MTRAERRQAWLLRNAERAGGYMRRMEAGETVADISAADWVTRSRIYQVLSAAKVSLRPDPPSPPDPPPYKPSPTPPERPRWSYPDADLLKVAREGRAEIERALRLRGDP